MSKRVITMGTWDGKPIEWIVLKEDGFQTLVISRYPLFSLYLSWVGKSDSWIGSNLREYLNNDFFQNAFTNEETKKIISSFLSDPDSTKDNIFLLSRSEAENLMSQDERKCGNGSNCNGHNCIECYKYSKQHGTCCFLRTPSSSYMTVIGPPGDIRTGHGEYRSVRPAMYIKE